MTRPLRLRPPHGGFLLLAALLLGVVGHAQEPPRPFTDAEQAALSRGALIIHTQAHRRDGLSLVGGTSWQVIALPPDAVWRGVLDTAHYPQMLPACAEARVVSHDDTTSVIYIRQSSGPVGLDYFLETHVHAAQRDLTFTLDPHRPHGIRAAWGFFTVRPYGADRSLLAYGVMADIGEGLIGGVLRPAVHGSMMRVPQTMRHWIEGRGRARYLAPEPPPTLDPPSPAGRVAIDAVASRPAPPPPL